jgi:hypothetical protein
MKDLNLKLMAVTDAPLQRITVAVIFEKGIWGKCRRFRF